MKKGKYINNNILLACLSGQVHKMPDKTDIHRQLAKTLLERRQLFAKYRNVFAASFPDIHTELQHTIREFKRITQHIYKSTFNPGGSQAA
jgi:hypothetical protein